MKFYTSVDVTVVVRLTVETTNPEDANTKAEREVLTLIHGADFVASGRVVGSVAREMETQEVSR